ncbi:cell wall hydrolase [Pseudomonas sp. CFBP 8771]|uniref:cell wall hydrolase n=1 Tax=unclassified Pseudomonas TaxID=196821 RepID=UPI001782479A|nr:MULTISPECIES: cell wall hydrolase [unclassified Pseudomonas]MBD8604487.1 cell wall hydrolase [Pseudomonas sp. CFBP 8771]MBD8825681.1 cell wall hydrolase [Pseudomonas sp. CFBP 13602]
MTHIQQVHDVVARTLWGEARGEGIAGQIAVAWVIRNRVHDANRRSWWGEGYIGVCHKPWQFSCWNPDDPNYPCVSGALPIAQAQWAQALMVAEQVIAGGTADPTDGATHYHALRLPRPPAWTAGATCTLVLGGHAFFKDVP